MFVLAKFLQFFWLVDSSSIHLWSLIYITADDKKHKGTLLCLRRREKEFFINDFVK